MKRKSFIQQVSFAVAGLTIANPKLFGQLIPPAWNVYMLTDKVGVFLERGGTVLFLLDDKGIVVVDSQFPDTAQHLIGELQKKSGAPIKYLINTHHHGDHSSGNIAFKGMVKHVVAHENSKKNQKRVAISSKNLDKQLLPDRTYSDHWQGYAGHESIAIHYFGSGHTDGDSFVHFENSNIVHMGDLLFNRRHPYVDRSSGASIKHWIKVLNRATRYFDEKTTFVFGHAAEGYNIVGGKDDLKKFRDYLGAVLTFTQSEINSGKLKDGFLKTTAIPGQGEWKGEGIARPLGAAWDELTAK